MLKHRTPYQATSAEQYVAREQQREITRLTKKAHRLGLDIVRPVPQPATR
jgi:hypothetical protein